MMNMSIECSVKSCKYNHCIERYCTLEHIKVGQKAKSKEDYSDCMSFTRK